MSIQTETHIIQPTHDAVSSIVEAKDALAETVQQRAKELDAVAIICLMDAYYARLDRTAPNVSKLYRLIDTIGVQRAAALGLCQLGEAIQGTIETRAGSFRITQPYLRNPDNPSDIMFEDSQLRAITPEDRSRFLNLL